MVSYDYPGQYSPGKTSHMVLLCCQLCRSCSLVLTVNLSNLDHLNNEDQILVHSRLIEIFLFETASNTY